MTDDNLTDAKEVALNTIFQATVEAFQTKQVSLAKRRSVGSYGLPTKTSPDTILSTSDFIPHGRFNQYELEKTFLEMQKPVGSWFRPDVFSYDFQAHMFSRLEAHLKFGDYFSLTSPATLERIREIERKYSTGEVVLQIDDLFFNAVCERMLDSGKWAKRERYTKVEFAVLKAVKPGTRRFGGQDHAATMATVQESIVKLASLYGRCATREQWAWFIRATLCPEDVRAAHSPELEVFRDVVAEQNEENDNENARDVEAAVSQLNILLGGDETMDTKEVRKRPLTKSRAMFADREFEPAESVQADVDMEE